MNLLLKNRDFALLFSGQFISNIGNNFYSIAILWYILILTHSKADLGLTGFLMSLPGLFGLFVGVFIDRWRKRATMIWSDIIRAVLCIGLFYISLKSGHTMLWLILMLIVVMQFVGVFFAPAQSSLIPKTVTAEQLPGAMGVNQSGSAIAQLGGMVGGGVLVSIVGIPLIFLSNAVSFVVSVLSLFGIRVKEQKKTQTHQRGSMFREWKEGIVFILRTSRLLRVIFAAFIANFALAPLDIVLPAWVQGPLHGSSSMLGVIMGALFVGMILSGFVLSRLMKYLSVTSLIGLSLALFAVCLGSMSLYPNLILDIIAAFISGFAIGIGNGAISTDAVKLVPQELQGRVFASFYALNTASTPLGMALYGFLIIRTPLWLLYVISAGTCLISALTFVIPLKDKTAEMAMANQTDVSQV